jgi:hypothetical protein
VFDIDAALMVQALLQFTQQSGLQLAFPSDGSTEPAAPRVMGELRPQPALQELLKGSGLPYDFVNARTVTVHAAHVFSADRRRRASHARQLADLRPLPQSE